MSKSTAISAAEKLGTLKEFRNEIARKSNHTPEKFHDLWSAAKVVLPREEQMIVWDLMKSHTDVERWYGKKWAADHPAEAKPQPKAEKKAPAKAKKSQPKAEKKADDTSKALADIAKVLGQMSKRLDKIDKQIADLRDLVEA